MKETLEGKMNPLEIDPFVDNCLGCLACVTSCPSGVEFGELISPYRSWSEKQRERGILERLQRFALLKTIPYPNRFRAASKLASTFKPLAPYLPKSLGAMIELAPSQLPSKATIDSIQRPDRDAAVLHF